MPALTGLRGIAVLAVVSYHLGVPLSRGGHLGVDLFFVLSGFLITSLLFREWAEAGRINLPYFYARRAIRLLPAFLLMLCGLVLAVFVLGVAAYPRLFGDIAIASTYTADWVQASGRDLGPLGHVWSLAVEEHYYILWPPVVAFICRNRVKLHHVLIATTLAVAGSATASWLLFEHYGAVRVFYGGDTRAAELLVGCLVSIAITFGLMRNSRGWHRTLTAGALVGICVSLVMTSNTPRSSGLLYRGGSLVLALSFAVIIAALTLFPTSIGSRILEMAPLQWAGRLSYSLYLWQPPILWITAPERIALPERQRQVVRLATPFLFAFASYWLVETRFNSLKKRFRPYPSPEPTMEMGAALQSGA